MLAEFFLRGQAVAGCELTAGDHRLDFFDCLVGYRHEGHGIENAARVRMYAGAERPVGSVTSGLSAPSGAGSCHVGLAGTMAP